MAYHPSAEKRIRQTEKRTQRNKHIRSTVRGIVKRVRTALTAEDVATAEAALKTATQWLDKAVTKGVYHRKTASRTISRLTRQVVQLARG